MAIRIGFLSTYPATQCGIATFCQALAVELAHAGAEVGVVRLVDVAGRRHAPVVMEWLTSRPDDAADAATLLNTYDVVIVQHEYGIYGGVDGVDVLEVVARLTVPVVTVLHTVLTTPTAGQHRVLAWLIDYSSALVTMTTTARDRLVTGWDVDESCVSVIAHGALDNRSTARAALPAHRRPIVLTWGLLSEGKGIEWALLALDRLRPRLRLPRYQVVGQTHPRVLEVDGDAYRDKLLGMTSDLGLTGDVTFDGRYLSGPELLAVVRRADVILLPYDSTEQVTSGVLTEAVAAGKPVISTNFPHAVELLDSGAGILVPRRDPDALAAALEYVLGTPGAAAGMAATSSRLASTLLWPAVARRYLELADALCGVRAESVA